MRVGFSFTILDTVDMTEEEYNNKEILNKKIQESLENFGINRTFVNDIEVEVLD